jgi:hypothetical protein
MIVRGYLPYLTRYIDYKGYYVLVRKNSLTLVTPKGEWLPKLLGNIFSPEMRIPKQHPRIPMTTN